MKQAEDFTTVTFGKRTTEPCRTVFGIVALFRAPSGAAKFFRKDGEPVGPLHADVGAAWEYAQRKGWGLKAVSEEKQPDG